MKQLLLFAIRVYWLVVPKRMRRHCLFKCSCSQYVFAVTKEKGFRTGRIALRQRKLQCRPGYRFYKTPDGMQWVILADRSVVPLEDTRLV